MEKSQTKLPILDILINKSCLKVGVDIHNKTKHSKRYVPFTSNHPWYCLTNIMPFLERRICTIIEDQNAKDKHFKQLRRTLLEQK